MHIWWRKRDWHALLDAAGCARWRPFRHAATNVLTFDKIEETYRNLELPVNVCESAQDCIDNSDVVVIMHPDKDFSNLDFTDTDVIDLWGLLKE